jgi:hypothetical protein
MVQDYRRPPAETVLDLLTQFSRESHTSSDRSRDFSRTCSQKRGV